MKKRTLCKSDIFLLTMPAKKAAGITHADHWPSLLIKNLLAALDSSAIAAPYRSQNQTGFFFCWSPFLLALNHLIKYHVSEV